MDISDPRLIEAHKKMTERVEKYDERIVTVLKGSLSTEQALNDLLSVAGRRWKRRTFAGKIDKAEKLFCPELDAGFWATIKAANALRNAVAHGHSEGQIVQRSAELKKALLAWVSPEQRPGIEAMTEPQMISTAFNNCSSYLVVAADQYGK
ncbi:hypothetical protein JQ616_37940 [Bradyrhizobium tropiciagri]|uniref:hypothetical protein n=1 Tax=Bradyrhizobium tropiciagri TaxID=312253 RepID=UPI001BA689ED|nr:hypothetical protein [Bradyrhizobium tropiciagri]MBR0900769.1 hypothetical protein [Bradyrhizobium tropiciagri]